MRRFGVNVRTFRKRRGYTQEQMRDYGFNYRYFQKIEAGLVNPTLGTILKLANTLKCSMSEFLK